jgi:hypothetical protein
VPADALGTPRAVTVSAETRWSRCPPADVTGLLCCLYVSLVQERCGAQPNASELINGGRKNSGSDIGKHAISFFGLYELKKGVLALALIYGASSDAFVGLIVAPPIALGDSADVGRRTGVYLTIARSAHFWWYLPVPGWLL